MIRQIILMNNKLLFNLLTTYFIFYSLNLFRSDIELVVFLVILEFVLLRFFSIN